jgi:hypothetical protein
MKAKMQHKACKSPDVGLGKNPILTLQPAYLKKKLKEWDETTKPQYVCMQFHIFGAF